jgi:nicotinamidase-related amidase
MLIERIKSCLLVVDIQERLLPAINEGERVIENTAWLMQIAQELEVPLLVSEQYPKGLGHTVPALLELTPEGALVEKIHFSCAASPACQERLAAIDREHIVVTGIEAHVCVLQTAIALTATGKQVFVVADAVSSRRARDAELGLERMRAAGVHLVSREMVAFEWLHRAGTAQFREISRRFLR